MSDTTSRRSALTTGEAAALCEVSVPTVRKWIQTGLLPHFTLPGSATVRILREDLYRFMDEHGIPRADRVDARIRLLIVDDDRKILDLLERAFDDETRFDVRSASTGFDAGLLAGSFAPDVVLLDIRLPDIDGRRVIRGFRAHRTGRQAAVIAISGQLTAEEGAELIRSGFDAYLPKPFKISEVRQLVLDSAGRRTPPLPTR